MTFCGYNVKYHEVRSDAFIAVTTNNVVVFSGAWQQF